MSSYSNPALDALRRNVSGKVASGESEAIIGIEARYRIELSDIGFHVRDTDGTYVAGHTGCRHLNGIPTFAARHLAQACADDLNTVSS